MRTQDINRKAGRYIELQDQIRALQTEASAIADELKGNGSVTTNRYSVKVTRYSSTRFDSRRFREDAPEIYESYCRETEATRLTVDAA